MQYRNQPIRTPAQEDKVGTTKMIVYHGTNSDFDRFDETFLGQNTEFNATDYGFAQTAYIGFWFNEDADNLTSIYNKILECEIEIENPFYVESLADLVILASEEGGKELRERLISEGYDGIMLEDDEEFGGTSYIVFNSNQIEIK